MGNERVSISLGKPAARFGRPRTCGGQARTAAPPLFTTMLDRAIVGSLEMRTHVLQHLVMSDLSSLLFTSAWYEGGAWEKVNFERSR